MDKQSNYGQTVYLSIVWISNLTIYCIYYIYYKQSIYCTD